MLLHAKNVLLHKRRFVSHDCLHADIIVFTRAAIDNKPSSADRKKQLYEIVRNGRNAGKTVRSRDERYHDGKLTPSRENMMGLECEHLQGSCRYRQSMLCSRPRPVRRAGRGFSRFASRIPHSDYSTRGNSILSLRMHLSLAPPSPFRKSPHNHLFNIFLHPFDFFLEKLAFMHHSLPLKSVLSVEEYRRIIALSSSRSEVTKKSLKFLKLNKS